jgi:CRISPR/Cas system-associated exonuclease Cas4 (RecB family)
MALDMLHPEDDPFDSPLQFERMTQGIEAEHAIVARLHDVGPFCKPAFTITEQQHRFEVKDRDSTVLVTGKMDGRIRFEDGQHPPIEIKSGRSYESAETVEDLDRNVWARTSIDQLLSYLYADDPKHYPNREPWGFILVRRQSDLPSMIRINLLDHLARVESFMQEARKAVDARHGRGDLPPFIGNPSECRRCPHLKKSCTPPLDFGPGVAFVTDPALVEAAAIRERNRVARDEYERADKALKDALRGVESAIVGDFMATGKWSPGTTYDVPKEIKQQYAKVNPQGRFTLTIERIGGAA